MNEEVIRIAKNIDQNAKFEIKDVFKAKQLSARGGELICELYKDRVLISGKAVKYLEGKISIEIFL